MTQPLKLRSPGRVLQSLRIYFKLLRIHFLSGLEYKGWWLMLLQVMLNAIADPISAFFLFSRFGGIGPWTVERIILIFAIGIASFGLAETFCRGFDYFPWRMIRSGEFDRLLLRPRSLYVQIAGAYFHIHRLGRVLTGLLMIIWSLSRQGIALTFPRLLLLLLALLGGLFMYSGVFILSAGIAFFTVRALDWIYILTNASYQVTRCPVEYMPRAMYLAFTFLLPLLVISYYPASVICGWGEATWTGFLALPVGLLFLWLSTFIWRIGMRHYKSTGS